MPQPLKIRRLTTALTIVLLLVLVAKSHAEQKMRQAADGFYEAPAITKNVTVTGKPKLRFNCADGFLGTIEVRASSRAGIRARISLSYKTSSSSEARRLYDLTQVGTEVTNNSVVITIGQDEEWNLKEIPTKIVMDLDVPTGAELTIGVTGIEVSVDGPVGDLTIATTESPITVDGARGNVKLNTSSSELSVRDLVGGFVIDAIDCQVSLSEIVVRSTDKSDPFDGSIVCEGGKVDIDTYSGPLRVTVTGGEIRAHSLSLAEMNNSVRCENGEVELDFSEIVDGSSLSIRSLTSDVTLSVPTQASAAFHLKSLEGGNITVEDLPHKIVDPRDNGYTVLVGDGKGQVSVSVKGGAGITLRSR